METQIIDYFKNFSEIIAIYLFGSYTKGQFTESSDVDLAIYVKEIEKYDYEKILQIKSELSSLIKHEVDCVLLNQANPIIKFQVFKYGKELLVKDKKAFNKFYVQSLNEYFDLKIVRKKIEDSLVKDVTDG